MRLFKSLFMLTIGMMVGTAFASTQMPEKNQSPTIEKKQVSFEVVADVLPFQVLTIYNVDRINFESFSAQITSSTSYEPQKQFAIFSDVGWHRCPVKDGKDHYFEKLNAGFLIDHEKLLKNKGLTSARNNC